MRVGWYGMFHFAIVWKDKGVFRAELYEREQEALKMAKFRLHNSDDGCRVLSIEGSFDGKELYHSSLKRTLVKSKED